MDSLSGLFRTTFFSIEPTILLGNTNFVVDIQMKKDILNSLVYKQPIWDRFVFLSLRDSFVDCFKLILNLTIA